MSNCKINPLTAQKTDHLSHLSSDCGIWQVRWMRAICSASRGPLGHAKTDWWTWPRSQSVQRFRSSSGTQWMDTCIIVWRTTFLLHFCAALLAVISITVSYLFSREWKSLCICFYKTSVALLQFPGEVRWKCDLYFHWILGSIQTQQNVPSMTCKWLKYIRNYCGHFWC